MELKELREEIDKIDEVMLPLFLKRMKLGESIAEIKKNQGLPVYSARREQEILSWAARESGDMAEYAQLFFSNLFELSRSYQTRLIAEPDPGVISER